MGASPEGAEMMTFLAPPDIRAREGEGVTKGLQALGYNRIVRCTGS